LHPAAATLSGAQEKFLEFEQEFGKVYKTQGERQYGLECFTESLFQIRILRELEKGSAIYSHLTPFADLCQDEFAQRSGFYAAGLSQQNSFVKVAKPLNTFGLPEHFDWRDHGAVNKVKNQKQCGSCWAFATVANIEGAGFVENKKLLSLSEQQLIDCDKKDWACQGGLPSWAYTNMIKTNVGLEAELDYPYTANVTQCVSKRSSEKVFINSWVNISTDEDQIAAGLIRYGPLAIGINAGPMSLYKSGVAYPDNSTCNPTGLNHAVNIVGFGIDNGTKYWAIRNSWGEAWGEKGYYRIVRGMGACGLNTAVTSATEVTISRGILV